MSTDHQQDHHHGANAGAALWLAVVLTLGYAMIEASIGWWAGSLALLADAGHMVSDAGALMIAAAAAWMVKRPVSRLHSYGLGRAEFLAALINSLGMLALITWITISAAQRLM
ncbi:MAG: cation diffusion facilitator family transporter, partial [Thioalkalivibrio sp.]